jgi:hypothetical protein
MGYTLHTRILISSIFFLNYNRIYKNGYYIENNIILGVNFYFVNAGEVQFTVYYATEYILLR